MSKAQTEISKLRELLQRIGEGDLTIEIQESKSKDEMGKLWRSFNHMITNLRKLVVQTQTNSTEILSSSQQAASSSEQMNSAIQQVSATIQQISKGAQTQAHGLDETNKVIEDLGITMKDLVIKAQSTAELSKTVERISVSGGKSAAEAAQRMSKIIHVADESAEKIKGLAERSAQITSVLDMIRKIAEQTNLLALNAAIEAARAGDAGRGFAVVADEVRRLAESSAKSSDEIATLIKQIQDDSYATVQTIEEGSKEISEGRIIIDKALESLKEIANKVQDVSKNIMEVSTSSQAQFSEVEKLAKAASEIAAVSEENASATEEASAAIEEQTSGMQEITSAIQKLADVADNLTNSVSVFRLDRYSTENNRTAIGQETRHSDAVEASPKPRDLEVIVSSGNGKSEGSDDHTSDSSRYEYSER